MTVTVTDAVWRIEQAKLIAGLVRMVRDVGPAEELAQDALVAALEQWPKSGIPDKPGAWLMATAKHRAIDRLRLEAGNDPQAQVRPVFPVFAEDQPEDGQAERSRRGRRQRSTRVPQASWIAPDVSGRRHGGRACRANCLTRADGKRTFAVILQKGDEAMRCLQDFAVKEGRWQRTCARAAPREQWTAKQQDCRRAARSGERHGPRIARKACDRDWR